MAVEVHTKHSGAAVMADRCDDHVHCDMDAIFSNWQFLAAVAWRGYQTHGCGAVVVSLAIECADVAYASGALPASYARFVERYDPLEQIVVVVRHHADEHVYVMNGWPSPQKCFEAGAVHTMNASLYCLPRDSWQQ